MSCNDIPSLLDLQKAKLNADDLGRLMGTGEGDSTNEVTGQVRPTYNKVINDMNSEFDGMIVDMNSEFDGMISDMNSEFDTNILNMGFTRIGTFSAGATITNPRQTLLWDVADGGDGQEYGWSGSFPLAGKVVPPGSTPLTTGGIAVGAWMSRFDPELRTQVREALRRSYAEAGYNLVDGSFEAGGTLVNANDVLLHEARGRAYSGAGPFPQYVDPITNPLGGLFVDRSGELLRTVLASDDGDVFLYGKGEIEGQVKRSQRQRNSDETNIFEFGGADDYDGTSGTNNLNAIALYTSHLINSGGGVMRFPKNGTGVYFVSGTDGFIPEIDGIEIIADEGVSFVVTGGLRLFSRGIKCNREIPIRIDSTVKYNADIGPNQFKKPSEQFPGLSQSNGVMEVPELIDPATIVGYDITGTGRSVISVVNGTNSVEVPFSLITQKRAFSVPVAVGEQVNCYTSFSGVGFMGVLTVNRVITIEVDSGTGTTLINDNGVVKGIATVDPVSQPRNRLNSGLMSVVVTGVDTFSVLVNNVHLYSYKTNDPIISAIFGNFGNTAPVLFSGLSKISGQKSVGSRPLRIICLGDSTSQPDLAQGSQYDYMRQFLASAGCQIQFMKNLSVGGDTSGQQLTRFNAEEINGYDFCIAQLGINDVQAGIPYTTFASNMGAIADKCSANNVRLIASVPTSWYPQSEAAPYGQVGQNTVNSDQTARYVAALITTMATKGQLVSTQAVKHEGMTGASWLDTDSADRVLMDNIHPSAYGRMMMGLGNAKAILGAIHGSQSAVGKSAAGPARWLSAFTAASTRIPGVVFEGSMVRLVGCVDIPSIPVDGTVILKIDRELVTRDAYYSVISLTVSGPASGAKLWVKTNGDIQVFGVPAGAVQIALDGVVLEKG